MRLGCLSHIFRKEGLMSMTRVEEIVRLVENGEVNKALSLVPEVKKNGSD